MEWWEAPGIEGREAFDEEILYLNNLTESLAVPRWAVLVRDLMPRWGFEPCSHRFFVGLEQVMTMIGEGRAYTRLGGCSDVPLTTLRDLEAVGTQLVAWAENGRREGGSLPWLPLWSRERAEAVRVIGELSLAACQGPVALDEAADRWAGQASTELARSLVDGEESPLVTLLRHACAYNLLWGLRRLVTSLGEPELFTPQVCRDALLLAPQLDPGRLPLLRATAEALVRWLRKKPPTTCWEGQVFALLGPRDPVREFLVASLYKTIKLWLVHVDNLHGEKRVYFSLI